MSLKLKAKMESEKQKMEKGNSGGNWKIEIRKLLGKRLFPDAGEADDQDQGVVGGGVELLENPVGGSLRIFARGNGFDIVALDAVGGEEEGVAFADGKNSGLKRRQLFADNASAQKKHFGKIRAARNDTGERAHDIADAEPRHHAVVEIDGSDAENDAASGQQRAVAFLNDRNDWFVGAVLQNGSGGFRGVGGFFAMADAVDGGDEKAAGTDAEDVAIAGSALAGKREIGDTVFDEWMF